ARAQRLYPVVDGQGLLLGAVTAAELRKKARRGGAVSPVLSEIARPRPVVAYPDESLREAVYRMAERGHSRLLVVERSEPRRVVGLVALSHVLRARARHLEEERRLEGALPLPFRPAAIPESAPGVVAGSPQDGTGAR